jgi:hypothetical protein
MPISSLLALLLSYHPPVSLETTRTLETREEYEARLETIARAIAETTRTPEEAAAVITIWHRESHFRREVHDGTLKADHGLASCLGSIHPHAANRATWPLLAGTDLASTSRCARATLGAVRSGLWVCARGLPVTPATMAVAFEHYARGHCAEPSSESLHRAREWDTTRRRIWGKIPRAGE